MMRVLRRLLVLCVLVAVISDAAAGTKRRLPRHKFAVKTIQSEDGDIIDCVDVCKQPSLQHLPTGNRTIQIFRSRSATNNVDPSKKLPRVQQLWQNSGSCPEGTIPILRNTPFGSGTLDMGVPASVERAVGYAYHGGPFHGARGKLQRWQAFVEPNEYSMSCITLMTGTNTVGVPSLAGLDVTEFVRAGFMVHPTFFADHNARFFVQWTTDNGETTGCFNLACHGFVQTSHQVALGATLVPPSVYNDGAHQPALAVNIYLDSSSQRWYLEVGDQEVGFWPINGLFKKLHEALWVTWGGQILNTWPGGEHTVTQMGNGHPAEEGRGRAATIFDLTVKGPDDVVYQYHPGFYQDQPGCYSSMYQALTDNGPFITFGGSGGAHCWY